MRGVWHLIEDDLASEEEAEPWVGEFVEAVGWYLGLAAEFQRLYPE